MREAVGDVILHTLIVILMAGPAISRQAVVDPAAVALGARRLNVRTREREAAVVMVKGRAFPLRRRVTRRTVVWIAILNVALRLREVRRVARPAVRRRARVLAADVTLSAVGRHMGASQRKGRLIVIQRCLRPIVCAVAGYAVVRELPGHVVRIRYANIILFVA